jgi:hypothetical protein
MRAIKRTLHRSLRAVTRVPRYVRYGLWICLMLQIIWQNIQHIHSSTAQTLPSPPPVQLLKLMSFGDYLFSAKMLTFWVQSFDTQAGKVLSYPELDYQVLSAWLARILTLDSFSQYPLMMASYVYANVPDQHKKRQILEFIYQQFLLDPEHRWAWLAHATIVAKHRLHDLPLALKYARALNTHPHPDMPFHIREMQAFILEEMGELEQARVLIGGLLVNGKITDPHEIRFLNERLKSLEQAQK